MSNLAIQENIPLASYTTLKIGGPARWFCITKTIEQLVEAVDWARQKNMPMAILSAGSNTLVSDQGFNGLVILVKNDQATWESPEVTVGAGMTLGQLVSGALQHGLGGLWWFIGVPGSVGGAIYGNAGSRDEAIGQYVEWVDTVMPDGARKRWRGDECHFEYRHSIFKENKAIILEARLRLPEIHIPDEQLLLKEKAAMKQANQPLTASSAGCMFKNPKVDPQALPEFLRGKLHPDGTLSAWQLIVGADLQGKTIGQIQISEKHANFMVNLGGATADHVVQLLSYAKQQVRDKLGVQLQEEVQYLGF